jgi:hypothetical protein
MSFQSGAFFLRRSAGEIDQTRRQWSRLAGGHMTSGGLSDSVFRQAGMVVYSKDGFFFWAAFRKKYSENFLVDFLRTL